MLSDPVIWLFGLSVVLLAVGVLGVILSTRRDRQQHVSTGTELVSITDLGSEMARLHRLQGEVSQLMAECERLRVERDELRAVLARLAVLLDRAGAAPAPRRMEALNRAAR
jgi:uncharacterized protein YlxW (UPF0749 family)